MPKITKNIVDTDLRARVFGELMPNTEFVKINDRQYGIILTDLNGVERYIRIGAIVAEEREDVTARELMAVEIADYQAAQAKKTAQAEKRAKKIAEDRAKREAKTKEKEGE